MFSNKRIIKKTIFRTTDRLLYRELGLDDNFDELIINYFNLEELKDQFETYGTYADDYWDKVEKALEIIEKELEEVDEVQVLMDKA